MYDFYIVRLSSNVVIICYHILLAVIKNHFVAG